jgi:hypothetical protein
MFADILRPQPLRPAFEISQRAHLRLNGSIDGAQRGTTLTGSFDTVSGVDHLVIEPHADERGDFLNQLTMFARQVTPSILAAQASSV